MSMQAVAGNGPDVVLLHGWGTNARVWREVAESLSSHYRVHVASLAWECDQGRGEVGLERMADRLAAHAPRRCALCGWSLGALLAMAWARCAPAQVTRVALIAANPCFVRRNDWPHALEPWSVRDFARALAREPAAVLTRFIALQARGDARAARVARYLRQTLGTDALDVPALSRGLDLLTTTDLRGVAPRIVQPALVIHGARDAVAPLAASKQLAAVLPDARMSIYSDAGHAPFVSHAEEASAELARFFDER